LIVAPIAARKCSAFSMRSGAGSGFSAVRNVLRQTVDLLNVERNMPFRGDRVKAANRLPLQQPVECGLHLRTLRSYRH